jgi:RHS repeat-associated protein
LTTGSQGGIAFRVQDKNNYFLAAPWTSTSVRLYRVANGQVSTVSTQTISTVNWGEPHDWYLRADGEDLDLAVYVGGTWYFVFDSGTTGQGKLSGGSHEGAIGLGTTGESTDPVVCDTFTYGYDPDEDGSVTQVIGEDVFDGSALTVEPAYDAAGNLTDDGVYQYVYDAWNRLVQVKRKGGSQPVVATYRYDGLGHRVYKKVENSGDMNREEYFYYNQGWQLLEIDSADNVARQQFVWGTNYIDEAICMDVDTDDDGDCTDFEDNPVGARRFFHMQDANWNVVGLREGTSIVERYDYDPYGTVRIYRGSASAGAAEQRTVTAQSLKWLSPSLPGNPVLYAAYYQDSETGSYNVRNRTFEPGLARWDQRDQAGYADGMDLYGYVRNAPVDRVDPLGLWDWPWSGCCGGKSYNWITKCCCKKDGVEHIVSRRSIPTGIKSCFIWITAGGYPHAYVVVDGWSAGFYPDSPNPFGGPGKVHSPDDHAGEGTCTDLTLSPCSFDLQKVKDAIKAFADRPFGRYIYGVRDCRHWVKAAITWGTMHGGGCTVP